MSDISREDALAHFGVRGMRWGVRKKDDLDSEQVYLDEGSSSGRAGRKVAKTLVIGSLVATGAIAATMILANKGGISASSLHATVAKGAEASKGRNIGTPVKSLGKMAKAFRESGRRNKGYVPEATRLFKGQKYASYTMRTYGNLPVRRIM